MTKKAWQKWMHWLVLGLIGYFWLVEPEVSSRLPEAAQTAALATHAGMGMVLAVISVLWLVMYARGPIGRAGPKLPVWGKRAHGWLNKGLFWLLPVMVASGGVAGLLATYPVMGFGVVPLNPSGWGIAGLHDLAQEVHEFLFNVIIVWVLAHGGFHIARHLWLKDNALRIMVPKVLHRYL